jgi:hypothetical protein
MSLGVVIKGTEGIVLAADSRVTLEAKKPDGPVIPVNFDNATKLLTFSPPHNFVGAVTYGVAVIGQRTAHSLLPEFEEAFLAKYDARQNVEIYAEALSQFYLARWKENLPMPPEYKGPPMTFLVGGYSPKEPYWTMFIINIPNNPKPIEQYRGNNFGMNWGGQLEIASRLIHGVDPRLMLLLKKEFNLTDEKVSELQKKIRAEVEFPIPYTVLPLQDCVELAIFLISTTMTAQRLAIGIRGVGGPIDVAIITRTKGLECVQQKQIHGQFVTEKEY